MKIYLGKLLRLFFYEKDWKVLPMAALIAFVVTLVLGPNMFLTMEATSLGSLIMACVCIWNGFFNSVQSVCKERQILKREHRAGLHMSSYIAAHMIYQFMICLLQVLICMLIYYLRRVTMTGPGLMTGWLMGDVFITLFLITYAADMTGLLLSSVVQNTTTAMTVMPFLLIVQLVFSGTFFTLPDRVQPLSYLTVSRWGINSLCSVSNYNSLPSLALYDAVLQFKDIPEVEPLYNLLTENDDLRHKVNDYASKHMQKAEFSYTLENIRKDWLLLLGMALLCALLSILSLELIDRDQR